MRNLLLLLSLPGLCLALSRCSIPKIAQAEKSPPLPAAFGSSSDTSNMASRPWRIFYSDPDLAALLDTALAHNRELLITLQEVAIAKNEILYRKGALLPSVDIRAGAGIEKVGRYTSQGAGDASTEMLPGKAIPDPLPGLEAAAFAHWEADTWKKLRNSRQAAVERYLATAEGKNFVVTGLVAEVAGSYYELLALDNQLAIVQESIRLQNNALSIIKEQKAAGRTTELAVQKFEAELLNSQGLEYDIRQQVQATENRVNFLLGRYPQPIRRDKSRFFSAAPAAVQAGIPAQLLANRPDIKQAELELAAAKLDVKAARAEFYPSLDITAALGLQAFSPQYLARLPESVLYSLAGDLAAPLINRKAIKAEFYNANARQRQALYNYERSILNACMEVATQLSAIDNLGKRYELKTKEVEALTRSTAISNDLFLSARADYLEVLLTQRDALSAKLELVETREEQLHAGVMIYRALGGGWR